MEKIYGLPYDEAIEIEANTMFCRGIIKNNSCDKWHDIIMVYEGIKGQKTHLGSWTTIDTRDNLQSINLGCASNSVAALLYVDRATFKPIGLPITIGRVMQALGNKNIVVQLNTDGTIVAYIHDYKPPYPVWKLTNENGQELDDDSQTDECIEALVELLK